MTITKTTGLTVLGVGLGINVIDYLTAGTAGTGASATSSGGVFYKPGGILASFPMTGLVLIAVGAGIWILKR